MLHSNLPTVKSSRITQGVVTVGLVLAILAASVATVASVPSVSRVSAEAPSTQNLALAEATNLEAAASSAVESSSARLYAIVDDGFYLSTNGGGSWTRQTASSAPVLTPASFAVDPGDPLIVYLGTDYDGLFKSVDGGATFQHSSSGLGAGSEVAVTTIYLPASYPGLLMATTANWSSVDQGNLVPQGLYVSTNKGQSWFKVSDAAGATAITSLNLDSDMVVTARSSDGALQSIRLESALSAGLMQYGVPEARRQVPLAMAFLGMDTGEMELNRRFLTGEDLPATISSLALLGTPSAIATLVSALADTRESARWHLSMQSLEYLGEKAVPALITGLSDDDAGLRGSAAELLGWIGSATAIPALELALWDDDQAVRESAAWALGELR